VPGVYQQECCKCQHTFDYTEKDVHVWGEPVCTWEA
jgi:hypothetical protein